MPEVPRLTAEAEVQGSAALHPKIVKQVLEAVEEASIEPISPA
jgi:hypothetical protein